MSILQILGVELPHLPALTSAPATVTCLSHSSSEALITYLSLNAKFPKSETLVV